MLFNQSPSTFFHTYKTFFPTMGNRVRPSHARGTTRNLIGATLTLNLCKGGIPDQCVDFGNINVIHFLHSVFDLGFVGPLVNNEHQCVVIFNLFHGRLCGQGEFHDLEMIQPEIDGLCQNKIIDRQ